MRLRLDRLGRLLEPAPHTHSVPPEATLELAALVDRVLDAGRPVLRTSCLVRGLTRYYFLRQAGAPVSLCFGISVQPELGGHCWLEADGAPFLEARDPRPLFIEMYRLGPYSHASRAGRTR